MMNKEAVLNRKTQLEEERNKLMVQLTAVGGAIQDCNYWLSECDKEEQKPVPEKVTKAQPKKPISV
jgi:chaperonin cofactor prefoldin